MKMIMIATALLGLLAGPALAVSTDTPTLTYTVTPVTYCIQTGAGSALTYVAGVSGGPVLAAGLGALEDVYVMAGGDQLILGATGARLYRVSGGNITTVAGTGTAGNSGDNASALAAQFAANAVVADTAGNYYLADSNFHRIRKVDTSGNISTYAGTGTQGSTGDGGTPNLATLRQPQGLAYDAVNNDIYFCDTGNHRIRRLDLDNNKIYAFAGLGTAGTTGEGGLATDAQFNSPQTLALNGTDLYVGDQYRILKISGGNLSKVAGLGTGGTDVGDGVDALTAQYASILGMTYYNNKIYTASGAYKIRELDLATGFVRFVAGTGSNGYFAFQDGADALSAAIGMGRGLSADAAGNIHIADSTQRRVRYINACGLVPTNTATFTYSLTPTITPTFTASPTRTATGTATPTATATPTNTATVTATPVTTYFVYTLAGTGSQATGVSGMAAVLSNLDIPRALASDAAGNLYFADKHHIKKVDAVTGILEHYAGNDAGGSTGFYYPAGLQMTSGGDLYVADQSNNQVSKVDSGGTVTVLAGLANRQANYSGDGGAALGAALNGPTDVAVAADGTVYFSDYLNHRVRRIDTAGNITTVAGTGNSGAPANGANAYASAIQPTSIELDGAGGLYILETGLGRVVRLDLATSVITYVAGGLIGLTGMECGGELALMGGAIFACTHSGNSIYRIQGGSAQLIASSVSGSYNGEGVPAIGGIGNPVSLAPMPDGSLAFIDGGYNQPGFLRIRFLGTIMFTPTVTSSQTGTPTPTRTITGTLTDTGTPTDTRTPTATVFGTATNTATATDTGTATATVFGTSTNTATRTVTSTPTPTRTITGTLTDTGTPTDTRTPTATVFGTATNTATRTDTPTATATVFGTSTSTSTWTVTSTRTSTRTATATATVTGTVPDTATQTMANTPDLTPATATQTPVNTPDLTPATATQTPVSTATQTAVNTATQTLSHTPTLTPTNTATFTNTRTATPTRTFTSTPTPLAAITVVLTPGFSAVVTVTGGASIAIPAGAVSGGTLSVQVFNSNPGPAPAGLSFSLKGRTYQIDLAGGTLLQPVTLTFPYDPASIPRPDPAYLGIAFYDGTRWVHLSGSIDPVAHTVTVTVDHFSLWSVSLKPDPAEAKAPAGSEGVFVVPSVKRGEPLCANPSKPLQSSDWTLYNLAGQRVSALSFSGSVGCLQTGALAPGFYLLKQEHRFVDGSSGTQTRKIVVKP